LKLAMKAQNLRYGKFANIAKLEFETCVSLPSGEIKRPPYPFGAPAQRSQGGEAGAGTLERCWLWQDSGAADNYRVGVVIGALKARGIEAEIVVKNVVSAKRNIINVLNTNTFLLYCESHSPARLL
jgi:hypothetical protein